jgi:hypothetical protein
MERHPRSIQRDGRATARDENRPATLGQHYNSENHKGLAVGENDLARRIENSGKTPATIFGFFKKTIVMRPGQYVDTLGKLVADTDDSGRIVGEPELYMNEIDLEQEMKHKGKFVTTVIPPGATQVQVITVGDTWSDEDWTDITSGKALPVTAILCLYCESTYSSSGARGDTLAVFMHTDASTKIIRDHRCDYMR